MDVVYKFLYVTFNTDTPRERFVNSRRFVPSLLRYMCAKNYFNVKTKFWQSYCKKGAGFLGHSVYVRSRIINKLPEISHRA